MHRALFLLLAGLLAACSPAEAPAPVDPALSAPPAAAPASAGALVVLGADGQPAWTLQLDGSHVEVARSGGERWVGEQRGDKRQWRRASDGAAVAEVKGKGEDFKLRTPDSVLLWKVKLYDDKIKISDNEENQNPYTIKTGYPDKAKLEAADDSELGVVRFSEQRSKVKDAAGNERFVVDGSRRSAAWAVLLLEGIPEEQRGILLAELMARGR